MAVRKRVWETKNGPKEAWIVDYADTTGTRRQKTFPRQKDAKAWWNTQGAAEIAGGTHTPDSQSKTVAEAGELWIRDAETGGGDGTPLETSTVRQYRQHLRLHILPLLGRVKLNKMTTARVAAFRNKLGEQGRSPAMVKKIMVSLGSLIAVAQENGLVARNVARELPRRRRGHEKRHQSALKVGEDLPNKKEIRAILRAADADKRPIVRPLIYTLVFTGMRASELRGLRWADVDLRAGVINLRQRADFKNQLGSLKSASAERAIPLPPILINTLKEWKLARRKGELDIVFPTAKGGIHSQSNLYILFVGAVEKAAGLCMNPKQPKYSPHTFRHAYASLCIDQGLSPKWIQEKMGHSTIAMTYDVYGHLFPAPADDAAAMKQIQASLIG